MESPVRQGRPGAAPPEVRALARYRSPDLKRSLWQVVDTAVPYTLMWLVMLYFAGRAYWLTLLLAVPTAGFLIRLFIIQHDCGHGAFFRSARVSNALGFVLGILT